MFFFYIDTRKLYLGLETTGSGAIAVLKMLLNLTCNPLFGIIRNCRDWIQYHCFCTLCNPRFVRCVGCLSLQRCDMQMFLGYNYVIILPKCLDMFESSWNWYFFFATWFLLYSIITDGTEPIVLLKKLVCGVCLWIYGCWKWSKNVYKQPLN